MNTLQFNSAGLEEMTFAEMHLTDGGVFELPDWAKKLVGSARGLTVAAVVGSIIEHWDDVETGFAKGYEQGYKNNR